MAGQDKQVFIKGLVSEQRRQRPLMRPSRRAMLWFLPAFLVSAILMYSVQEFRTGFAGQLFNHPFLLIEVISAQLISVYGAYLIMVHATPGERLSRGMVLTLIAMVVLFVIGLSAAFTHLAPESTTVGARHACWIEVVSYGAICLAMFVLMIRRGFVRYSWKLGLLYGCIAGLVPSALMQLACMYDPMHGLIHHYFPFCLLILPGLLAMWWARRK